LTKDSLAVAIEALSWMAYAGIGERAALLKASQQMSINEGSVLREAHKWIMETSRFQNRLDWFVSQSVPSQLVEKAPHGIRSLYRIMAYVKLIESRPLADLERIVGWARQIIGWREIRPYEESLAKLVFSKQNAKWIGQLSELDRLALETCHPTWYVQRVALSFGRSTALRILERDLSPVSTFARINDLKVESAQFAEQLHGSSVEKLDGVFILDKGSKSSLRGELASSGKVVIQDLGSIVAGLVASPKPGQVVLDICASPGNKTSHMAAQMRNEGQIYSIELSTTRSRQWRKEMARTGCSIAELIQADAATLPLRGQADVALVDPPCSNSGVFARNPASKWRVTSARVRELVRSQSKILQAASEHVVEGGTLVYCTCSILPEEDEIIVEAFLRKHNEFKLIPQVPFLGSPGFRGLADCQRFYPHLHNCNGYFIAKLHKG
jgi:16S rRNA C967 or C1407 C5-methylase (RsmB/RsmF family)